MGQRVAERHRIHGQHPQAGPLQQGGTGRLHEGAGRGVPAHRRLQEVQQGDLRGLQPVLRDGTAGLSQKTAEVEAGIYEKELPLYIREESRSFAHPPVVYGKKKSENARVKETLNYRDAQGHNDRVLQNLAVVKNGDMVFCQYDNA